MKAGEEGTDFYVIVSGKCDIIAPTGETVATLSDNDYCGEQGLLRSTVRNATVKAAVNTVTLRCNKKLFDNVLREKVRFARREPRRKAIVATYNTSTDGPTGDTSKTEKERSWLTERIQDNIMFSSVDQKIRGVAVDNMFKQTVLAGIDLITQGDVNARTFYVVESGEFDVFVDSDHVGAIQRGGCFGELALMYDRARAATCRASQDSVVWVVDRYTYRNAIKKMQQTQMRKNIDFLRGLKIFSSLLNNELSLIDEAMIPASYSKDDVILKQGDDPDKFYIIKKGTAIWSKKNKEGNIESGPIEAGSYFGELALLNDQPRAATIKAKSNLVTLELSRTQFKDLLGPLNDILSQRANQMYQEKQKEPRKANHPKKADLCALSEMKTIGILGKGAFGVVSLVVDPKTNKSYALKAIKKFQIVQLGQQSHILNEKRVMELLNNDFLVNLRGTFKDKLRVYFVLDVCLGGELFTILRKRRYFDESTAKFYAACVINAFDYMHGESIIYRDLKPENLVLDSKGYLKVTDFGFAKVVEDRTFTLCGTPDYLAPEIVTGQGHGKGVDWWTLGILIYEMLASFPPFFDDEPIETYKKIIKCRIKFPRYFSPEAKELIKQLLRSKPVKRLGVLKGGANLIRRHSWFADFGWDNLKNFKARPPIKPKVKGPDDMRNFEKQEADDDHDAKPVSKEDDFDDEF